MFEAPSSKLFWGRWTRQAKFVAGRLAMRRFADIGGGRHGLCQKVQLTRHSRCRSCNGSGAAAGSDPKTCTRWEVWGRLLSTGILRVRPPAPSVAAVKSLRLRRDQTVMAFPTMFRKCRYQRGSTMACEFVCQRGSAEPQRRPPLFHSNSPS